MMDRLNQKNYCSVISATNRYPDCYGIDGWLEGLVAFKAALALKRETLSYSR
jgi:hypothetical protein